MNGIAAVINFVSVKIKGLQSGQIQQYAYVFVTGVLILVIIFIYLWK